ncbi:enoyl-CoA hydratase [Aquabacterium sp. OR-4]|uniref:enoyl-CoA hydratase n=1 Tax=Aquabacterium sp. OR-4 TaxID=2978127 RepID=UPI0021B41495|nr:enoyl-CoA hydratase [Aquabacterium sp. OR-4]MDT7836332.1 enoyl-CoA hydratase [Aquabacterium sp. OR-4]
MAVDAPDTDLILTEIDPAGFAVLTLNRPQAMNALSRALMRDLASAIDRLSADERVRVIVLTGAGRAFSAGLDLKEIGAGEGSLGSGQASADPVAAIERCPKPVIGAINGAAVTGGFELALACDVLLASSAARFADTHARVGVSPGWGLSQRLSRAIGPYRAREVSFTGNWVSAEQAAEWGFVNRVVAPEALLDSARALARDMLGTLPEMLLRYKAVINEGYRLPFGEGMALEKGRAREFNAQVTADGVEQRREAVRARNRGG